MGGIRDQAYQKRRFDRIASCTDNAPSTEKNGRGYGDTNENGVDVVNLGKGGDAPEKVDGRGDDGGRGDEQANLQMLAHLAKQGPESYHPAVAALPVHKPPGDLAGGLNDQEAAEALGYLEDGGAVPQRLVPGADGEVLQ